MVQLLCSRLTVLQDAHCAIQCLMVFFTLPSRTFWYVLVQALAQRPWLGFGSDQCGLLITAGCCRLVHVGHSKRLR